MAPEISIIMLVYNRERYLGVAIESVLTQTFHNFELIVWDDGSTDDSLKIAAEYARQDPRVKVFTAEHRGIAPSLNAAFAQSCGRYLGLVDSDDLLANTALEEAIAVLDSNLDVGLAYTDYTVIDEQGRERKYGGRCSIPYSKEGLLEAFMVFHFRLFRRELFEQIGGVDESLEYGVDYDLCLRLSEVTEFLHLEKPLYYYRSHPNNVSNQASVQQKICSEQAVYQAKVRRGLLQTAIPAQSFERSETALSQVRRLSFYWSPTRQYFACNETIYENQGSISTDPSHDLVHLFVAANGGLPWLPDQDRTVSCFAEYNAVLLENLFDKVCNALIFKTSSDANILAEVLAYMHWFVQKQFAPFPVSSEVAYQQFCSKVNPFVMSRLFPYFIEVKKYERSHLNYREAEYQLSFTSTDQPASDEAGWLAQWFVYQYLKGMQSSSGISDLLKPNAANSQLLLNTLFIV